MNKYRIVIASVLKPVTEPRAFSKLALSMRETSKYHINIIGFCSKKTQNVAGVRLSPIFFRHRTHIFRLFVPLKFLLKLVAYRPHLVIVTTYELLPMALLGKMLLGFRLVYDLQENYAQNLLLNESAPKSIRSLLATSIKAIEKVAHPFIDHYFFAEQIYHREFPYIKNYTVLENKYTGKPSSPPRPLSHQPTFIISGTITPVYGIEKAVRWFMALQGHFPQARLQIVGHVPLRSFQKKLEQVVASHPNIHLNISSQPLAYDLLLEAVRQADVVLMPYETSDSIRFKIPTKLYESIGLMKPVLISKNPVWQNIINAYPAGIAVDFANQAEAKSEYLRLLHLPLYQNPPKEEVTWAGEKSKLMAYLEKVMP